MRQAFVPATGLAGEGTASKKRRRAVAAGDGQAVSSIYEGIVQPGKKGGLGNSGSNSSWCSSIVRDTGYGPGAHVSPTLPPSPTPAEANERSRARERARTRMPAPVVFGPAPNPQRFHHSEKNTSERDGEELEEEEGFFCRVCGERVRSVSEEQHRTSTLHIFNQKHRPPERKVQIHESNKGFQLLAGMGWKVDEGLGAQKQGRVNPLQTTFKRGTTGLGAGGKLRPRVTHFPPHVASQALNAADGKSDAVRAHESLDRRQGRRHNNGSGSSSSRRKRRLHDSGGGGGGGFGGFEEYSGGGAIVDVAGAAAATAAARGASDDSWGGFWGQGTHPNSNSSDNVGSSGHSSGTRSCTSGSSRSSSTSSSGRRKGGGGGSGAGGTSRDRTGYFMSRKEREGQSEREKRKGRKARFELLSDVPEEYAALFVDERI